MRASRSWLVVAVALLGCDPEPEPDRSDPGCQSAKCDLPTGTTNELCEARRSEVLDSTQRGFTREAIRWACADVEGVTSSGGDDRGQEYCEYFALVRAPGADAPAELGRILGGSGEVSPLSVCLEDDADEDCGLTLTEDEQFDWEDDPSAVVGACVFSSWHTDVPGPLPAEADVLGMPLDEEHARMKRRLNGNGAASGLVQDCVNLAAMGKIPMPEDWGASDDPLVDPFYRGCATANENWGTGWRRSDSSVCAVANRLVECGCSVPGVDASELGATLVPPQPGDGGEVTLRGFPLGSWEKPDTLPGGCRYAEIGEDSQIVVVCDLTASDVLANMSDPKERCRELFGNQVVVHVPLPAEQIECAPPETEAASSCGSTPWNLGNE
jgi:hypothetical protein